jgi:hypothetical protein
LADRINEKEKPNSDYQQELSVMQPRAVMRHNVPGNRRVPGSLGAWRRVRTRPR